MFCHLEDMREIKRAFICLVDWKVNKVHQIAKGVIHTQIRTRPIPCSGHQLMKCHWGVHTVAILIFMPRFSLFNCDEPKAPAANPSAQPPHRAHFTCPFPPIFKEFLFVFGLLQEYIWILVFKLKENKTNKKKTCSVVTQLSPSLDENSSKTSLKNIAT